MRHLTAVLTPSVLVACMFASTARAQSAALASGKCDMWIDGATGSYLPTTPVGTPLIEQGGSGGANLDGRTHLTNGVNAVRVPCPPPTETGSGAPPPPRAAGAYTPPYLTVGQFAGSVGVDYSYFSPNVGNDGLQFHLNANGVVQVAGNLGLQAGISYNSVATGGPHLNNWNISGGLDFHVPGIGPTELTLAPIVGYQQTHQGGSESKTIDYGAATRLRLRPSGVVIFARAGGFSTTNDFCSGSSCSGSDSSGFFTGGGVTFYPDDNFSITPSIDYTHFDPFGGSEEFDYSLKGVHKLGPVDIVLEYDHNDFAPGNFHVNTVSVGISIPLGYHRGVPLRIAEDSDVRKEFSPLYFRF